MELTATAAGRLETARLTSLDQATLSGARLVSPAGPGLEVGLRAGWGGRLMARAEVGLRASFFAPPARSAVRLQGATSWLGSARLGLGFRPVEPVEVWAGAGLEQRACLTALATEHLAVGAAWVPEARLAAAARLWHRGAWSLRLEGQAAALGASAPLVTGLEAGLAVAVARQLAPGADGMLRLGWRRRAQDTLLTRQNEQIFALGLGVAWATAPPRPAAPEG